MTTTGWARRRAVPERTVGMLPEAEMTWADSEAAMIGRAPRMEAA